jgi:hypothetical protein
LQQLVVQRRYFGLLCVADPLIKYKKRDSKNRFRSNAPDNQSTRDGVDAKRCFGFPNNSKATTTVENTANPNKYAWTTKATWSVTNLSKIAVTMFPLGSAFFGDLGNSPAQPYNADPHSYPRHTNQVPKLPRQTEKRVVSSAAESRSVEFGDGRA